VTQHALINNMVPDLSFHNMDLQEDSGRNVCILKHQIQDERESQKIDPSLFEIPRFPFAPHRADFMDTQLSGGARSSAQAHHLSEPDFSAAIPFYGVEDTALCCEEMAFCLGQGFADVAQGSSDAPQVGSALTSVSPTPSNMASFKSQLIDQVNSDVFAGNAVYSC